MVTGRLLRTARMQLSNTAICLFDDGAA